MPAGAALTTISNSFTGNQGIGGSLILSGAGSGVQFADGTLQTTAATGTSGGGGNSCSAFELSSASPVVPAGYTALGTVNAGNVWFAMAPMPTGRYGLATATVDGKIYAIGGTRGGGALATVEVYDPVTNSWSTTPAPMPTARYGLAAATVNGKTYAIGGTGTVTGVLNLAAVEVYDPVANSWSTTAAPMTTTRTALAVASVNGKIYAIGGFSHSALATVEVYDPVANSWSTTPAPMTAARFSLAAADAGGLIYAVGGILTLSDLGNATEQYTPPVTIHTFIKN